MKKPPQFPLALRITLSIAVLAVGLLLSWTVCGLSGTGLLVLLPFAAVFFCLCPEFWRRG